MCIIIYKEWDKKTPKKDMIETCWENNPDGAGFMVIRKKAKAVEYHKGYMTLDAFKTALSEANIKKEDTAAYHFRITTSGGTNPAMTHPFEVSPNEEQIRNLHGKAARVFMHNGILGPGSPTLSDTASFVMKIMTTVRSIEKEQKTIAEATQGSRTLTFDAYEGVLETGTWHEDEGLKFSNQTYLYGRHTYAYPRKHYYYEDDFDYDWKGARSARPATYPQYGKLYKLNDVQGGWSDECFDDKGCGYGFSGSMYCPGCEFFNLCDRAQTFLAFGTLQERCPADVDIAYRTHDFCNACPSYVNCATRTAKRYHRNNEFIHGRGYCIRVY